MPRLLRLLTEVGPVAMEGADSPCVGALRPSPNHGDRAGGRAPDSLILHYTGMPDGASAIDWLCNPASNVSCHYVVEEGGLVLQLVPEARRAWHAGRSVWAGETDMNSASIGIEIVNPGHAGGLPPYPEPQVAALLRLCSDICRRCSIEPSRVLAHSDIAPDRKQDPGERFPWAQLHAAGIGLWVPPFLDDTGGTLCPGDTGAPVEALQAALAAYGYGVPVTGLYDDATQTVVRAFQRHFRAGRVDGRGDAGTRRTLDELLRARGARPA